MRGYRPELLVSLALFALTLAVFWPACQGQFVSYDDPAYVSGNPRVQGGLSGANGWWALTTFHAANWHPLTWLSLQLDASVFGPGPFGFHLTSVLLHAANSALLFCALRLLTGALWRSAFVAGLFALHPLHVESVAWVSERKDVLCALFFMLTLLAYGWYARRPGWRRYLPVALALALGLLAKPMLVTVPCLLLLLDYWPLRRQSAGWRALVLEKLPLFVLTALSCLLTWHAQRHGQAVVSLEAIPLPSRLANAVVSYAGYLQMAVWPAGLTAFYDHPREALPAWKVAGALLLLTAFTWMALAWGRRQPYLAVGWLWYLGMLVPVIGLVQVGDQAMADRYTYLPLIGIFLAAAWGLADLAACWGGQTAAAALAALVLLACAACTRAQLPAWHDSVALWRHALDVNQHSAFAHHALAGVLRTQGDVRGAREELRRALEADPDFAEAHMNLANLLLETEGDPAGAAHHFREALRLDPALPQAHYNLGVLLARQGRLAEAAQHFAEAVRLDPEFANAHVNLGLVLGRLGRWGEAAAALGRAAELQPGEARCRLHLAFALHNAGRPAEALSQYREATRLEPGWLAAANRAAWALAAHPDPAARNGAAALELAQKLRQATGGREPAYLDTLAAAYAETGRYAEAEAAAREALALNPPAGAREEIEARLRLYEGRQPFRQTPAGHGS